MAGQRRGVSSRSLPGLVPVGVSKFASGSCSGFCLPSPPGVRGRGRGMAKGLRPLRAVSVCRSSLRCDRCSAGLSAVLFSMPSPGRCLDQGGRPAGRGAWRFEVKRFAALFLMVWRELLSLPSDALPCGASSWARFAPDLLSRRLPGRAVAAMMAASPVCSRPAGAQLCCCLAGLFLCNYCS